jgi:hypothetical protein
MTILRLTSVALTATLVVATGCHRRALGTAPAPAPVEESPCWWAVFRTTLPVDTVTAHLVSAFTTLGLTNPTSGERGDTAWAEAGPARLDAWYSGTYSARMAAFRRGDSTLYRYFVTVTPPPGGWPAAHDTVTADGRRLSVNPAGSMIGFCQAIARVSANHGTFPNEPDGEESLPVWRRRP